VTSKRPHKHVALGEEEQIHGCRRCHGAHVQHLSVRVGVGVRAAWSVLDVGTYRLVLSSDSVRLLLSTDTTVTHTGKETQTGEEGREKNRLGAKGQKQRPWLECGVR